MFADKIGQLFWSKVVEHIRMLFDPVENGIAPFWMVSDHIDKRIDVDVFWIE